MYLVFAKINVIYFKREVGQRINYFYKASAALKSVLRNFRLEINAKKSLYYGVIIPTMLYGP